MGLKLCLSHFKGGTRAEGFSEQGAQKNIQVWKGRSNREVKKAT